MLNAYEEALDWTLPGHGVAEWAVVIDTSGTLEEDRPFEAGAPLPVAGRSCVLLTAGVRPVDGEPPDAPGAPSPAPAPRRPPRRRSASRNR